ncbi:DNA-processing protein DprA [Lentimicrobium sp. S6]|uniref:DNA-processing protein DprA n=1 Tax=Lentimicrobium sp. S6 TaxID=2735872 RepID=UPI0015553AF8|nr:DNA-processing protein DprA [Lentimicrobium sp. S6]NPD44884.1 DNA-protecting protein DprA [Lentimicrobium sp. S6]
MIKTDQDLIYEIGVSLLPGVGSINGKKLVAYCRGAEGVFKQKKSHLEKIEGIGSKLATLISEQSILADAEKELAFIKKENIQALFFNDAQYPYRLKQAMDSPLLIYYKGIDVLNYDRILAIVGTRNITERGKETTDALVEGLKDAGVLVVSGLAYGVDTRAHKACVKHKIPTVGVVAHGLDTIYPAVNRGLSDEMQIKGGVISEFVSGTKPDAFNFPQRNRVIAGMADATLVVESAKKGGSLITADIANSYSRDVYAIPGRPEDQFSRGCNFLIKTNRAALVENAADLLYQLSWDLTKKPKNIQHKLFLDLKPEEQKIVDLLRENKQCAIDILMGKSGLTSSKLASTLLNLEFEGVIKCMPGKVYQLLR